jgi:hypothetical protein
MLLERAVKKMYSAKESLPIPPWVDSKKITVGAQIAQASEGTLPLQNNTCRFAFHHSIHHLTVTQTSAIFPSPCLGTPHHPALNTEAHPAEHELASIGRDPSAQTLQQKSLEFGTNPLYLPYDFGL